MPFIIPSLPSSNPLRRTSTSDFATPAFAAEAREHAHFRAHNETQQRNIVHWDTREFCADAFALLEEEEHRVIIPWASSLHHGQFEVTLGKEIPRVRRFVGLKFLTGEDGEVLGKAVEREAEKVRRKRGGGEGHRSHRYGRGRIPRPRAKNAPPSLRWRVWQGFRGHRRDAVAGFPGADGADDSDGSLDAREEERLDSFADPEPRTSGASKVPFESIAERLGRENRLFDTTHEERTEVPYRHWIISEEEQPWAVQQYIESELILAAERLPSPPKVENRKRKRASNLTDFLSLLESLPSEWRGEDWSKEKIPRDFTSWNGPHDIPGLDAFYRAEEKARSESCTSRPLLASGDWEGEQPVLLSPSLSVISDGYRKREKAGNTEDKAESKAPPQESVEENVGDEDS